MIFDDGILSIQIRPDLIVRVAKIPHDLTKKEAAKIVGVIRAMASGVRK